MSDTIQLTVLVENTATGKDLLAEHGLSFHLRAGREQILFDVGQSRVLLHNAERLGVDLSRVRAMALSHGHYDHTGGLPAVWRQAPEAVVYLHPAACQSRYVRRPEGGARAVGMTDPVRTAIRRKTAQVRTVTRVAEVCAGVFLTGEIPRDTDFEDVGGPFVLDEAGLRPDPIRDDQALFFDTADGVVVVLGCAHSGVVNTLRHVRRLTHRRRIHAVLGGMHLLAANEHRIERTFEALREMKVQRIGPAHCTGALPSARLWTEFPGSVSPAPSARAWFFNADNDQPPMRLRTPPQADCLTRRPQASTGAPGWRLGDTAEKLTMKRLLSIGLNGAACLLAAGGFVSCVQPPPAPTAAGVNDADSHAVPTAGTSTNSALTGPQVYFVKGIVQEIKPGRKVVVVKHEEIPGYMAAMTMPFDVKDPNDLALVKAGDKILFRMLVTPEEGWIDRITVLESYSMGQPPARPTIRIARNVDPLEIGDPVPNYPFVNELGQAVSLGQFKGKAVALTFFFTRCPFPNFCPRMSGNFFETCRQLKVLRHTPTNWHLLSVSFDVEFDTTKVLRQYAQNYKYDPQHWSFLTGALIDVDALSEQLGLVFSREEGSFNFNHTCRTAVIDTRGRLQHVFVGNEWKPEELVEQLLKAAAVPPEGKAKTTRP